MTRIASFYRRSWPVRVVVGFVAAALLLVVLGLFTADSHLFIPHFDDTLGKWMRSFASPYLTVALRTVTRLGSTLVLSIIGVAVVAVFLYMRRLDRIGSLILLMAGQGILQYGFKAIFDRQRPEPLFNYVIGDTPSFPSGHALASMCFFGLLAYYFSSDVSGRWRALAIWLAAAVMIFFVGVSRVYFDVHYPSDVVAGYLAGFIWTASVASIAR